MEEKFNLWICKICVKALEPQEMEEHILLHHPEKKHEPNISSIMSDPKTTQGGGELNNICTISANSMVISDIMDSNPNPVTFGEKSLRQQPTGPMNQTGEISDIMVPNTNWITFVKKSVLQQPSVPMNQTGEIRKRGRPPLKNRVPRNLVGMGLIDDGTEKGKRKRGRPPLKSKEPMNQEKSAVRSVLSNKLMGLGSNDDSSTIVKRNLISPPQYKKQPVAISKLFRSNKGTRKKPSTAEKAVMEFNVALDEIFSTPLSSAGNVIAGGPLVPLPPEVPLSQNGSEGNFLERCRKVVRFNEQSLRDSSRVPKNTFRKPFAKGVVPAFPATSGGIVPSTGKSASLEKRAPSSSSTFRRNKTSEQGSVVTKRYFALPPPPAKKKSRVESLLDELKEYVPRMPGVDYKMSSLSDIAVYRNRNGNMVWVCLACNTNENEHVSRDMVCCEMCDDWYHCECVGIRVWSMPKDDPWYCKRCLFQAAHNPRKDFPRLFANDLL